VPPFASSRRHVDPIRTRLTNLQQSRSDRRPRGSCDRGWRGWGRLSGLPLC